MMEDRLDAVRLHNAMLRAERDAALADLARANSMGDEMRGKHERKMSRWITVPLFIIAVIGTWSLALLLAYEVLMHLPHR